MKIGIVGQGCAGMATAYHVLRKAQDANRKIQVDVLASHPVGSGATGVAAGLLHPLAPSGKPLWMGMASYEKAVELVREAGRLFRPAATDKQRRQFEKNIGWDPREDLIGVRCTRNPDGFYIPEGIVMDTKRYLEALWSRCVSLTGETASGSTIALHQTRVNSLQDLRGYDATVIAAGAAVQSIAELRGAAFAGTLDLCQGYTVELVKEAEEGGEHQTHNSMLGQPYVAFQNKYKAVIGATQRHGVTFHEAFQILEHSLDDTSPEADAASDSLVRAARELVPALADGWRVARVRSGVRAIPSRTHLGSIPYAGRLMGEWDNCWIIAGLGARGLVYHALLGELTAGAVLGGLGNDEAFEGYRELLRWMDNTKTVR